MSKLIFSITLLLFFSQSDINAQFIEYSKAQVNFDDFENLMKEVKCIREERLLSLDDFLNYSRNKNTVILDTRSKANYDAIHIEGAINLPFTEFTTANLRRIIPDTSTRILIYCNNNIKGDPIYFASKTVVPGRSSKVYVPNSKAIYKNQYISLALNVPTYINLYGYGYRNIYELDEFVDIGDSRVEFIKRQPIAILQKGIRSIR